MDGMALVDKNIQKKKYKNIVIQEKQQKIFTEYTMERKLHVLIKKLSFQHQENAMDNVKIILNTMKLLLNVVHWLNVEVLYILRMQMEIGYIKLDFLTSLEGLLRGKLVTIELNIKDFL